MSSEIIYVGVKAHVAAIDKKDGRTLWRTKLQGALASGGRFVTLLVEEGRVYAHTHGELFCLNAKTGEILWKNALDGLSYDIVSLAAEGISSSAVPSSAYRRNKKPSFSDAGASSDSGGGHH